ncbi:hypothetical protein BKA64DRAFT_662517 [Cadophora sp. MPI-SDFR-AT-0126]|nr:hypothetical protein BKA64DRAFT_662517 [Leotiomycetes sp. MPI-SDFR-AT-0126]
MWGNAGKKLPTSQIKCRRTTRTEREVFTIHNLPKDLRRSKLVGHKMPSLLRVVEGELPKGRCGKVQKRIFGPDMFPFPARETRHKEQVWKKSD